MDYKVDFAKISNNGTKLTGILLEVKFALDVIHDLIWDYTPQVKISSEQLRTIDALMTGVKLMASNASDLACELEKEAPSTNTADKN